MSSRQWFRRLPGRRGLLSALSAAVWSVWTVSAQSADPAAPGSAPARKGPRPRIGLVAERGQLVPGPWAQGAFGDWALTNGRITALAAGVESKAPVPYPPGTIVDAARCDDPFDELQAITAVVYRGDERALPFAMKSASVRPPAPGAAGPTLVFEGGVSEMPQLRARAELGFGDDPDAVLLTTTVTNVSTTTLYNVGLGDQAQWALLAPFVERFGVPKPTWREVTYSSWVGARMDDNSLGLVAPKGRIEALHQGENSYLRYQTTYQLAPGQSLSATRSLFIGGRYFSELSDHALKLRKEPYGWFAGKMVEEETGKPVPGVETIIQTYTRPESLDPASSQAASTPQLPYTVAVTDQNGEFSVAVPVGRAYALPRDFSRLFQPRALGFAINAGVKTSAGLIKVAKQTTLTLRVADADTGKLLPSKVQVSPVGGGITPQYGPPYQASGTRRFWSLATGEETIPVPRGGRYQVIVSRGIEYTTFETVVTLRPGENASCNAVLRRVVDTSGYIGVDMGVQTDASYNCRVAPRDAVVAAASEGVEWLVAADIDRATDLRPAIEAAGLRPWLGATRGMRIAPWTRDLQAGFQVLPVTTLDPGQRFSADYLENGTAADVLRGLRRGFADSLLAVNTPWEITEGYFRSANIDLRTGKPSSEDFCYDFDLFEIFDGRLFLYYNQERTLFELLMLQGHYYHPFGASSSREIYGNEPGYPRTYVGVPDDDPAKVTEEQILAGLRKGDVVVTNGPFIRMRVEGKGPGELVQSHDKKVKMDLQIWAAPWIEFDMFQIDKDGLFYLQNMRPPVQDPLRFPIAERRERNPISIEVDADVTLQVMVVGRRGPMPVLPEIAGRRMTEFPLFAITGPIFVDGDGDGKFSPPPDGKPRY